MPQVTTASPAERDRSIATLVTAFTSDPLIRWMLPEPKQYLKYFPEIMRYFGGRAFDHDTAHRTDDFMAAALWLPPGVAPDMEALGEVMQDGLVGDRLGEVAALMEQVDHHHPEPEHWYLPAIGVDPRLQGMGYGSALLEHALATVDRDDAVAYLESSNPSNIPLYQKFGFEVVAEIQVGSSPPMWPMLRPARSDTR